MEDQDDEYQTQMREELSHVPLGELKAMQAKLGLKAFKRMKTGSHSKARKDDFKRLNKHRPAEFSSKRPISKQREVIKEKTRRDPRFDDLSGEFNSDIFKKSYSFLDDIRSNEKNELKKIIGQTKDKDEKIQLKVLYNRMEQREKLDKRKEERKQLEQEWKKEEKEKVLEGKKPYFLKKSELNARFKEHQKKKLEESGKLQKYTERKNKKIAAREKKQETWKTEDV